MPVTVGSSVWNPPTKQASSTEMDLYLQNMKLTANQPVVRTLPDTFVYAKPPTNYIPPKGTETEYQSYLNAASASTALQPLIASPWDIGGEAEKVTVEEAQEAQRVEQLAQQVSPELTLQGLTQADLEVLIQLIIYLAIQGGGL